LWGEPQSEQDIFNVFTRYCKGELNALPWNDVGLSPETEVIISPLVRLNHSGFLTINSQPRVNAADSTDPKFGWGGAGGFVYQKAYVEFFASPDNYKALIQEMENFPSLSYVCANMSGDFASNLRSPCAVTWGVFPGKEITQPTVVDPDAFLVWKDEAFSLWKTQWAKIYEVGSSPHNAIMKMHDTYYLIAVVDNNFISGNIFTVFENILNKK